MEQNFIPYESRTTRPNARVLVLAPHADDEIFGCGGAVIAHCLQGDFVQVVVTTDGRMAEPQHPNPDAYVRLRQQESLQAAHLIGYAPEFWPYVDRELSQATDLVSKIINHIESVACDMVYAPSLHEIHPDHFALAQAAVHAITQLAKQNNNIQLVMYEVGVPLAANVLLNITPYFAQKQRAMACFASQLKIQDYRRHVRALNEYRSYTLGKDVLAAEAYYQIDGLTLLQQPHRCFGQSQQNLYFLQQLTLAGGCVVQG